MRRVSKQMGISLVEILVALVISLFLLAGIVQVYVGNKATFAFTNALAEIQENGRFALDSMSQDLRLANEWGCIRPRGGVNPNVEDTLDAFTVPGYNSDFHDFLGEDPIEIRGLEHQLRVSDELDLALVRRAVPLGAAERDDPGGAEG